MFFKVAALTREFAAVAHIKSEVLRTDADIFDVWARFSVAGERLRNFVPTLPGNADEAQIREAEHGVRLIHQARDLISDVTRARVSMPKSCAEFVERCEAFSKAYGR